MSRYQVWFCIPKHKSPALTRGNKALVVYHCKEVHRIVSNQNMLFHKGQSKKSIYQQTNKVNHESLKYDMGFLFCLKKKTFGKVNVTGFK